MLTSDAAIDRARIALTLPATTAAAAWRVERPDRPGRPYYLIVFGVDDASIGAATIDASSGEIGTMARLSGAGPHLTVDAPTAAAIARANEPISVSLVWRPGRASRSPLYPLWEIQERQRTVFVDQSGKTWTTIEPESKGG